tara:strand:- start:535 stop:1575 length:1041 start_codon:yes stop_codon:yes gene_type:complete
MNYNDSIIIGTLKKYYGHHFDKMFGPWRLYASAYIDANKFRYISTNLAPAYDNIPFLNTASGNVTWTPGKLTIVSSSAEDKNTDTAAGASSIFISGVDEKYRKRQEIVNLSGSSTVNTSYTYRFLNSAYVYRSGNKGSVNNLNVGNIDISTGTTLASNSLTVPWVTILRGEGNASMAGYALDRYESVYITKIKLNATGNVSGQFSMWLTDRDAISGVDMVEMPYRAVTSTFNTISGQGEIIFEEPYYIKDKTIFFTVDKLTSKSLISIEACGLYSKGEEVYERGGAAITNRKRTGVRGYVPTDRDDYGNVIIEESKEKWLTKNAKLAIKHDTFYTMTKRNSKRQKM